MLIFLLGAFYLETTPSDFSDGQWDPLIYVSRRLQVESANPSDSGSVEIYPRFDANRDGYYDLVSSDAMNPAGGVRLWFGSATGYSSSNFRLFPADSGGNCDMADLNLDGWPELIHSGWGDGAGGYCSIYWGSEAAGGPDPANRTQLPNGKAEAVYVYDLDKDSYLDILLGGDDGYLYCYWGSSTGYSPSNYNRVSFNACGHNLEVADFNKDGYPDVVVPAAALFGLTSRFKILWGDNTRNLTDNNVTDISSASGYTHGITLGDFNKDGWLDVVQSKYHRTTGAHEAYIYFNNKTGNWNTTFSTSNMTTINPGDCYGGSAAYDFNGDGWLDLVFFRGIAGEGTQFQLKMYPNTGSSPYFRDQDSIRFGPSAYYTGGFIADFNRDGKPEIFANSGCGWGVQSYVLWGVRLVGASVLYDSTQTLSVVDDHHGGFRECGNVYDRSSYAWYESGIFSHANPQREAILSWISWDSLDVGAQVTMYIRTRWDPVSPWSAWRQVTNGELVNEAPYFPARDIQYQARFGWDNPAWMPWLERVTLETQALDLEEASGDEPGKLTFGSGNGLVWVSWPGHCGQVSLYSADGRRLGLQPLVDGRAEFRGLGPGVYYILVQNETLKVLVR